MLIIWLIALLYVGLGHLFAIHIAETGALTLSFIIITTLLLFFILYVHYKEFLVILYVSFIVRIGLVLVDLDPKGPEIPHSGDDTENFYKTAGIISEKMTLMGEEVYGGPYSKFLGLIFHMYGDDRLFVQFFNVLMALTAILLVIRIFRMLDVPKDIQWVMVAVMAFFPHSIIFSGILLRESVITLMVVLSLYFFVRWYVRGGVMNAVMSVASLIIGASFHTAVIGVLVGYLFGFIFYRRQNAAFRFTLQSLVPFMVFAGAITYIMVYPESISALPIYDKIDQVQNNNDSIYNAVTDDAGGSAYLTGLTVNSIYQMVLFAPIKVFYFIGSPMPWSVRSVNDLIGFFLDGLFYLAALGAFVRYSGTIRKHPILGVILISIIVTWIIFGLGISNAGTALRHRFKIFYIIIVALGLLWAKKKRTPGTAGD
ncbi:hypothetical protein ACBR55_03795 [Salinicoccus roseus]|uniref:hypothetical protein n=1 Tax=Salinicoccus roseus TaxID=45670 RepID=UPI003524413D